MNDSTQSSQQPQQDPFLDEVRSLKRAAFARSDDDMRKHFDRLRDRDRKHADRVIQPPKRSDTDAA